MRRIVHLAFALLGLALVTAHATDAQRPNIVLILADDLGWGDLSCYGNPRFKTPGVDRLARQGTLLTQFYQSGSVCTPARAALLTGRLPAELRLHGHIDSNRQENTRRDIPEFLDPAVPTLPQLLRTAGYATVHVGKWHLGCPPNAAPGLRDYGFDTARWVDVRADAAGDSRNLWHAEHRPVASQVLVDATLEELARVKERPFFLQLWLNDPHGPLAPSPEQMQPFRGKEPPGFTTPFAVYAATVTEMDRQIGRLLDRLDTLGLATNTLVIFSSDNGPEDIQISNTTWSGVGSAGPLRGRKRSLYEGGIRVPFLVRWPGVTPAGLVNSNAVVCGADLLPTLCELAGAVVPPDAREHLRGESVAAVLRGDREFRRAKPLLWEWRYRVYNHPWNASPILAIRDGGWKLLLNPDRSRVELYDLTTDVMEQNNLAAQHPDVVGRLAAQALAWQKTLPPGMIEAGAGEIRYPWPGRP